MSAFWEVKVGLRITPKPTGFHLNQFQGPASVARERTTSGRDTVDSALEIACQQHDDLRDKELQFLQSSAIRDHDDDRDREFCDVLLMFKPLIECDEGTESMIRGEPEQLPFCEPAQPSAGPCAFLISRERPS